MIPGYVLMPEGKTPLKPSGLFALGLRLRAFGRKGHAFVVGKEQGAGKIAYDSLGLAVSSTLDRLRRLEIGDGLRFSVAGTPLRSAVIRVVDWTPKPAETNGSEQVDLYVACLNELWGNKWRSGGAFVCKKTVGTNTWSDHAWGEAQDIFADWDVMDEIAAWTVDTHKELNVNYVILRDRIWRSSTKKWGIYTGEYHRHVHTSFIHDGVGTPPCAR